MSPRDKSPAERLNELLEACRIESLGEAAALRFEAYLSLLLRWNARTNLTAVRDADAILSRHFVECIACARSLPESIATLLDFGSGAGLPGIPVALCRPEIAVTLAESQGKKAAFLQEAVRTLKLDAAVYAGRAELLRSEFDCVILRAVDKMAAAATAATRLVRTGGWLALMTTDTGFAEVRKAIEPQLAWSGPVSLPGSERRQLMLGRK